MSLKAINYQKGHLEIIDQLLLPFESKYIPVNNVKDGWRVINKMQVRGAPAIAIVGCLSLAVELENSCFSNKDSLMHQIYKGLDNLVTARPTAVNIKLAADALKEFANTLDSDGNISVDEFKAKFISEIELMLNKDVKDNMAIGQYGCEEIMHQSNNTKVSVLTHCNTGSLATAGYGTALGVVRSLHNSDKLDHVYCTETRPYNQGARLTAYELVHDKIPATLIADSMVSALMNTKKIDAVIVGADRVAANGDTANKIGTYQIAIAAKHHNVPFYVAAPSTSIDLTLESGIEIQIEERPGEELTHVGNTRIAALGINCWNPAFDVTPCHLIKGIITEKGVFVPHKLREFFITC